MAVGRVLGRSVMLRVGPAVPGPDRHLTGGGGVAGWEPYTQVIQGGAAGVVMADVTSYGAEYIMQSWSGLAHPDISVDVGARQCAAQHAVAGAAGTAEWTGSCPSITPGSSYFSSVLFAKAGMETGRSNFTFFSEYMATAYQGEVAVAADRTITTTGFESWQDPSVHPGPATETIGGRTVHWTYDKFTSLTGTIEFATPGTIGWSGLVSSAINTAARPFTVTAREVAYTPTPAGWDFPASGTPRFALSVDGTGGVAAAGQQTLSGLLAGYRWRFAASNAETGSDPGRPTVTGDNDAFAICSFALILHRVGRRRSGVAPPLHQRRRTDGLGGGPMHQSPGLASRQLGGRARGIY